MIIKENELLTPYTTIGLGGQARYFVRCQSISDIKESLQFARDKNLRIHILGGGSNTVFANGGFDGLVIKIELPGLSFEDHGDQVVVKAGAGELWDNVVAQCVDRCLAGVECLSGIPGLVGALPLQNVGAYGQQIADTIVSLQVLDKETLATKEFAKDECGFGYRSSRFKTTDANRYIITSVTFKLKPQSEPQIIYPDIIKEIGDQGQAADVCGRLKQVREAVLAIRKRKSMLVDPNDPNSRSCGSFFTNVVLSEAELTQLRGRYIEQGGTDEIVVYPAGDCYKVSAAWLIEHAGFKKGEKRGGVGISKNHILALINYAGTAKELLAFTTEIQNKVRDTFGVELSIEPIIVE